jgi:cell division protein FtsL
MEEEKNILLEKNPKIELFKVILTIILIITMVVLAIVIFRYTQQIKLNPCDFCSECKNLINLSLI